MICKYLFPFSSLPFHSIRGFFAAQKLFLFSLMLSHLFILAFIAVAFGVKSKNYHQDQHRGAYHLYFHLGVLWFQVLTFKSLIQFEVIFIPRINRVQFHSFACGYTFFLIPFINTIILKQYLAVLGLN